MNVIRFVAIAYKYSQANEVLTSTSFIPCLAFVQLADHVPRSYHSHPCSVMLTLLTVQAVSERYERTSSGITNCPGAKLD